MMGLFILHATIAEEVWEFMLLSPVFLQSHVLLQL